MYHLTLPALTIGLFLTAMLVRSLRSSLVDVFSAEYIEAARARGLSEGRVVMKHALRNSLIATITVLAVNLGWLISSAVVIERVFDIPGLGQLLVESIYTRDFPTIQALTLVFGLLVIAHQPPVRRSRTRSSTRAFGTTDGDPARAHRLVGRTAEAAGAQSSGAGRTRLSTSASAILGLIGLAAIFAPLIAPYAPNAQNLANAFQPPSSEHLMGTDNLGRDIFSRVVYAARVDLQIGLILTYVPLVYGVILGAVAGYFGGRSDSVIMRLVDVVIAFPFLVLVIAILAVVGPGVKGIYIAVLAVAWAMYARLTRAEMLVLREQQFMLAGEALGFSRRRIIFRHAIPNLLRPNLVFSMADFVLNILLVASLSFLGLGVRPPTPEWGAMVAEGQNFLLNAWWITTLPGIVIVVVGIALSLVGDGLADRMGERFRLTV